MQQLKCQRCQQPDEHMIRIEEPDGIYLVCRECYDILISASLMGNVVSEEEMNKCT